MKPSGSESKQQQRWNIKGRQFLDALRENPESFIVDASPYSNRRIINRDLMQLLGPLQGRRVLELGCGRGRFAVFLARSGAETTGVDVGPDLVAAARELARINQVECRFEQANVTDLPFEADAFDLVVGIAILHHLSDRDLLKALQETHRVLEKGGIAVFLEPVENSRAFNLIQNLFPIGREGNDNYRPSILQRKKWLAYIQAADDRALTNRELTSAGAQFEKVTVRAYGFLARLTRLVGGKHRDSLESIDATLFRAFPPLRHLCRDVLVAYYK